MVWREYKYRKGNDLYKQSTFQTKAIIIIYGAVRPLWDWQDWKQFFIALFPKMANFSERDSYFTWTSYRLLSVIMCNLYWKLLDLSSGAQKERYPVKRALQWILLRQPLYTRFFFSSDKIPPSGIPILSQIPNEYIGLALQMILDTPMSGGISLCFS